MSALDVRFCPACGRARGSDDRYCAGCGRAFDGLAPRGEVAPDVFRGESGVAGPREPIVVLPSRPDFPWPGSPVEALVGWLVVGLGIGLMGVGALAAASASTMLSYASPAALTADWRGRLLFVLYGAMVDPAAAQRADAAGRLRVLGFGAIVVGLALLLVGLLAVARAQPSRRRWAGPIVGLGCAAVVLIGGTAAGASSVVAVSPTPTATPVRASSASVPVAPAPTPFGAPTPTAAGLTLPLPAIPFVPAPTPVPTATPTPVTLDAVVELGARFRGDAVRRTVDLDLQGGQSVNGQGILTRGQDVDFAVLGPTGQPVVPSRRVTSTWNFSFTAAAPGQYRLLFDNSFSTVSTKAISVRYTISR